VRREHWPRVKNKAGVGERRGEERRGEERRGGERRGEDRREGESELEAD
jgi:hypothetical protein